jgi:DNA-binding response OmpR family regulator
MYISVVEDNPAILTMVRAALELYGHNVDTYKNTSTFLATLQNAERSPAYDLVIVDLFLEQRLGTEVLEVLQVARPRTIPAILISAAAESCFAPIKNRFPTLPILRKPFKIKTLVSLINQTAASA